MDLKTIDTLLTCSKLLHRKEDRSFMLLSQYSISVDSIGPVSSDSNIEFSLVGNQAN